MLHLKMYEFMKQNPNTVNLKTKTTDINIYNNLVNQTTISNA